MRPELPRREGQVNSGLKEDGNVWTTNWGKGKLLTEGLLGLFRVFIVPREDCGAPNAHFPLRRGPQGIIPQVGGTCKLPHSSIASRIEATYNHPSFHLFLSSSSRGFQKYSLILSFFLNIYLFSFQKFFPSQIS